MVQTIKIKDAEYYFPSYDDYPNISKTGSLTGMKKIYGWDTKYVVRIGSYYYYLKSHPNADKFFNHFWETDWRQIKR